MRSIRIEKALDDLMEREADLKGMSTNAFISSILKKYSQWDRLALKYRFMTLSHTYVEGFLSKLEESDLIELSRSTGYTVPREVITFWFGKVNLETFLAYLTLQSTYQRTANFEVTVLGDEVKIVAEHDLSEKWSIAVENFLKMAVKSCLGVDAKTNRIGRIVELEFKAPRESPESPVY